MKKQIIFSLMIAISAFYATAQSKMSEWPELNAFHIIISQTFHPSEEGNLEPLKAHSSDLKEKAATLSDSKFPSDFNTDKIKAAVKKLKEETVEMDNMVIQKKSDKELANFISRVHDTFHEIIGLCNNKTEH